MKCKPVNGEWKVRVKVLRVYNMKKERSEGRINFCNYIESSVSVNQVSMFSTSNLPRAIISQLINS